jgi:acetyltransferase
MIALSGETSLPINYPATWKESATLKDGQVIQIRPILPCDAPRLQEGFSRLSPQTIYYRFLESASQLSDTMAARLAQVDYQNHMALVASILENGEERLVGVARYVLASEQGIGAAETAIVVRDDYQGLGLGTLLYLRLIDYARLHGVRYFFGTVHQSNTRVMQFIRRSGLPFEREIFEPGVFLVKIFLEKQG